MRNFEPKTQAAYLRAVRKLAAFLKASPDSANELRRFQLHLVNQGRSPITLNSTISGLKFFFDVTQGRGEQMSRMQPVRVPFTLGWLNLGDLAQARRDPDAALQLLQAYGDRVIEGAALGALSALATLQPGLDHEAADGTLDGTEYPRQIELSCHQALARAGDPRAADWLARAHAALMSQADALSHNISDTTLRQGFLHNTPHQREIVVAWAAASSSNGPSDTARPRCIRRSLQTSRRLACPPRAWPS